VDQLAEYLRQTVPQGGGGGFMQSPVGKRDDVLAQSAVIAPILAKVVPNWRQECAHADYYEFGQEREAAIRARTLLERQDEIADNLGDAEAFITTSNFHPWVWEASRGLWMGGHYRGALQTAGTALDSQLQALSGRSDVSGAPLVRELLSEKPPEPGKPRLNLPTTGNPDNDRNLRGGMRGLGEACFSLVRNLTTHNLAEFAEQDALEQMAVLSLFARRAEEYGVSVASCSANSARL